MEEIDKANLSPPHICDVEINNNVGNFFFVDQLTEREQVAIQMNNQDLLYQQEFIDRNQSNAESQQQIQEPYLECKDKDISQRDEVNKLKLQNNIQKIKKNQVAAVLQDFNIYSNINSPQGESVELINPQEIKQQQSEQQFRNSAPNYNFVLSQTDYGSKMMMINLPQNGKKTEILQSTQQHQLQQQSHPTIQTNTLIMNSQQSRLSTVTHLLSQTQQQKKKVQKGLNWGFIKRLDNVKNFIKIMKEKTKFRFYQKLTKKHFDLINDKCNFNDNKKNVFIKKLLQVWQPNNHFIIFWNFLLFLTIVVTIFIIPLQGSYKYDITQNDFNSYILLYVLPMLIFVIDIIFNFNTGYFENGNIVLDQKKIFMNYLQLSFWTDIIILISYVMIYQGQASLLPYICFFSIIYKLYDLYSFLDDCFQFSQKYSTTATLLKLIFTICWCGHMCACGFFLVGSISSEQGEGNWIEEQRLDDADWQQQYLKSLYFSFITMMTVGYGDVKPISNKEMIYVIVMTILSTVTFSFTVNTIGTIFQEVAAKQIIFKKQKFAIAHYMNQRNITKSIGLKILKYLDYLNKKDMDNPQIGQDILGLVSPQLKEELYLDYFGKILRSQKLFHLNFSDKLLTALTFQMKEKLYGPGELIFKQGQDDQQIYFIYSGEVDIFLQKSCEEDNIMLGVLKEGNCFGQQGFFGKIPRETSARSSKTSLISYLDIDSFLDVIRQFPSDYEKYCQLRDEIQFSNKKYQGKCFSCQEYNHSIMNCPLIHFTQNVDTLIWKQNYSHSQKREKRVRKNNKFKTKRNKHTLQQKLRNLKLKYLNIIREEYVPEEELLNEPMDKDFLLKTGKIKFLDQEAFENESVSSNNSSDESQDEESIQQQQLPLQPVQIPNEQRVLEYQEERKESIQLMIPIVPKNRMSGYSNNSQKRLSSLNPNNLFFKAVKNIIKSILYKQYVSQLDSKRISLKRGTLIKQQLQGLSIQQKSNFAANPSAECHSPSNQQQSKQSFPLLPIMMEHQEIQGQNIDQCTKEHGDSGHNSINFSTPKNKVVPKHNENKSSIVDQESEKFSLILNFDIVKEFKNYNPEGNFQTVMKQLQPKRQFGVNHSKPVKKNNLLSNTLNKVIQINPFKPKTNK